MLRRHQPPGLRRRELGALLAHGALTDEYVLEAADSVLGCLRAANATVRWLFLHSGAAAVHKKRREAVLRGLREKRLPDDAVLFTLMDCARLENALREALGRLLESRGGEWERERRFRRACRPALVLPPPEIARASNENAQTSRTWPRVSQVMQDRESRSIRACRYAHTRAGLKAAGDMRMRRCCLLYTSPSPRDATLSRMPSSA